MSLFSRKKIFIVLFLIAGLLSLYGVMPRVAAERANRVVAFVVEYKDIASLSYQSELVRKDVWEKITPLGVEGLCVAEYTGEDLAMVNPLPLEYGAAAAIGVSFPGIQRDRAVIKMREDSPNTELLYEYLTIKMPAMQKERINGDVYLILPGNPEDFKLSALVPDFTALDFCRDNNIPILFRPGPCSASNGERVAKSISWLAERYPQIKTIVPAGPIMAGYPNLKSLAQVLKEHNISFAQVEFVKQVGVTNMAWLMAPDVLPMHSLTKEEITSRNMQRTQIVERMARAAHERSIRLIMMRPYDLQQGNKLEVFMQDLASTKEMIMDRGYAFGWPRTMPKWPAPLAGAIGCALALVACAWFYGARFAGIEDGRARLGELAGLIFISLLTAGVMWKVSFAAKLAGGFCGAFIATEAVLAALEHYKKPIYGLLLGLFIVLAGGISIASFYGTTTASLRLTPFSGVKLTLLLPPLLLLLHDLKRKVHPESFQNIVERPALWGELILIGVVLLAMLVMALRSDNVSNVPGWEVAFRDFMERTLLVRPRTKEFMVGYPALILYYYVMRKDWAPRYREVFRVVSVLAFSSAVNTFCHFHTTLILSVARVLNGWWTGIVVGLLVVAAVRFIGVPLWKKGLQELVR